MRSTALRVEQRQHFAGVVRESVQGPCQRLRLLLRYQLGGGVRPRIVDPVQEHVGHRVRLTSTRPNVRPEDVVSAIARKLTHPGQEAGGVAKLPEIAPSREEDVLRHITARIEVLQNRQRDRRDDAARSCHEPPERFAVARGGGTTSGSRSGVGRGMLLHRP